MPNDSHISEESFDFTEEIREFYAKNYGRQALNDTRDKEGYVLLSGAYGDCYYSEAYWNSLSEHERIEEINLHYPWSYYTGDRMTYSGSGVKI